MSTGGAFPFSLSDITMENRIKHLVQPVPVGTLPSDFYEVCTSCGMYAVTRAVAHAIERQLALDPQPKWITFRDLFGSRNRVRTDLVRHVTETTREQRRIAREFNRERRKEEKEDRLPGDDELDW
jgi:hypothetical protein